MRRAERPNLSRLTLRITPVTPKSAKFTQSQMHLGEVEVRSDSQQCLSAAHEFSKIVSRGAD